MSGFRGISDGYVDVAARIAEFRTKYPEGSLQPADLAAPYTVQAIGADTFIVVVAAAYRGPEDLRPGVGMAYEPYPGRTPFTRGSELQNAETSAWGRAIVAALAADTNRGIASREEVRNREAEREPAGHQAAAEVAATDQHDGRPDRTKAVLNTDARLRKRIADHLTAQGKTLGEIAADFKAFTGKDIKTAKGEPLQAYLRHIGVPLVEGDQQWQTEPTPMVTQEQQRVLHTLLGETDMTPSERMEYVSGIVGHPVPSAHDLTRDEAEKVIAELTAKVSPTEPADWPKVTEPPK